MRTFVEIFEDILTKDRETSRNAAREVRRFLYSSKSGRDRFNDIKNIINSAPEEYSKIMEDWRQENFAMAVSVMYFLHGNECDPDFLFPWIFQLLQHENGNIRNAALRMIEHELGPLTYHIRCPEEEHKFSKLSPEHADHILLGLFISLHNLIAASWKPEYKRYKYIQSLPSGTYKTAQLIFSRMEEDCGDEYIKYLENSYQNLK